MSERLCLFSVCEKQKKETCMHDHYLAVFSCNINNSSRFSVENVFHFSSKKQLYLVHKTCSRSAPIAFKTLLIMGLSGLNLF